MKKLYNILFLVLIFVLSSCNSYEEGQGRYLGKSIGYKDFLWEPCKWEEMQLPSQSLQLNKKGNIKKSVELQVVYLKDKEKEYKPAYTIIDVFCNEGIYPLKEGKILISPHDKELNLQFRFNKNIREEVTDDATYKLYFKILDPGDLDQINRIEAKVGSIIETEIYWQVQYEDVMNPLEVAFIWIGIIIVSMLVLWFALLRWIIFPTFAFDNLQVAYFDGESRKGREDCSLHGARKIICSASPKYQNGLNKLFCGRVEYLTNPFWTVPVVMTPSGSDGITVREDMKAGDAATYRMAAMITAQNGPRRPFVVKRTRTELVANISIG